jgi:hypothetical protein
MGNQTLEQQELIEQRISLKKTINAGEIGTFEIPIPEGRLAQLRGFGHDWYDGTETTLIIDTNNHPKNKGQQGSISQPVMYANPFKIKAGHSLKLEVNNTSAENRTYTAIFYLFINELLQIEGDGEAIIFDTGLETGLNILTKSNFQNLSTNGVPSGYISNMYDNDITSYFQLLNNSTGINGYFLWTLDKIYNVKSLLISHSLTSISSATQHTIFKISEDGINYTTLKDEVTAGTGTYEFSNQFGNLNFKYLKIEFDTVQSYIQFRIINALI